LRDWIAGTGVSGPQQAELALPQDVIDGIRERYARAQAMLCGA
jgi:phosphoribosylaminoimidazole-succinocarboxamide synthase